MHWFMACLLLLVGVSEPSAVENSSLDLESLTAYTYRFDPAAIQGAAEPSAAVPAQAAESNATQERWGQAGSANWLAIAAVGSDLADDQLARVGAGISYFIADDFSIDADLNFGGFWQAGADAYGANFNLLLRWHFLHDDERSWTVYMDGGAGMLLTSDDVPETGSSFNFTPQFGFGASFDIGDENRLFVGGRWFHVSNARLYENNPGQDYALFYVMLGWPF